MSLGSSEHVGFNSETAVLITYVLTTVLTDNSLETHQSPNILAPGLHSLLAFNRMDVNRTQYMQCNERVTHKWTITQ